MNRRAFIQKILSTIVVSTILPFLNKKNSVVGADWGGTENSYKLGEGTYNWETDCGNPCIKHFVIYSERNGRIAYCSPDDNDYEVMISVDPTTSSFTLTDRKIAQGTEYSVGLCTDIADDAYQR